MKNDIIEKFLAGPKNSVLIGEAGSGKTETALNLSIAMAARTKRPVHFFDMDQTKPLFRARDVAGVLEREGVVFHYQAQYMDAPTVVSGVIETLMDEKAYVLMDVGGGSNGSHMIGQFSHILNRDGTRVLYILNPYRAWSGGRDDIEATMARVLGTARLRDYYLAANPNLGPDTGVEDVLEGLERLRLMFPEREIEFVCALKELCPELETRIKEPLLPISLNTLPEWLLNL